MKHTYQITGMTCSGCVNKVRNALERIKELKNIRIDLQKGIAEIDMDKHIPTRQMQDILQNEGSYTITSLNAQVEPTSKKEEKASGIDYKRLYPLFLVFAYLIGGVVLTQIITGDWNSLQAMRFFMGGFFVVFSFFKLLDIKGFAASFSTYDPIASRWRGYGFIYPFIELALGIAYLTAINLFFTNIITLVLVSIGTIGVGKTLLDKRKIQCACLGTVFNLPMTKVTLTENSVMIIMAILMLI